MLDYPSISSSQNPRIKAAAELHERRARNKTGLFLLEGARELERAHTAGYRIDTLFICPEYLKDEEFVKTFSCQILQCTPELFKKISYRENPDGLIAVVEAKHRTLADIKLKKNPFLVIVEQVEKPGNLGAILRSCDAAGVDGVILCDPVTDIYNPNVIRASTGTLFTVPIFEAASREALAWLQKNNIALIAATPSGSKLYLEVDFNQPVAIAVGAEKPGLSEPWMNQISVKIPMLGTADSLNVSTATALLLYEVVRQRRSY